MWVESWDPLILGIHGASSPEFERFRASEELTSPKDRAAAMVIDALVKLVHRQSRLTFPNHLRRWGPDGEAKAVSSMRNRYRRRIKASIEAGGYQGLRDLAEAKVPLASSASDIGRDLGQDPLASGTSDEFGGDLPKHILDDLRSLDVLEATSDELRKAIKYAFRSPLALTLRQAPGEVSFRLMTCHRAEALLRALGRVRDGPDAARIAVILATRIIAETTTRDTLSNWHLGAIDLPEVLGPLGPIDIQGFTGRGMRDS